MICSWANTMGRNAAEYNRHLIYCLLNAEMSRRRRGELQRYNKYVNIENFYFI